LRAGDGTDWAVGEAGDEIGDEITDGEGIASVV
jgi:hypothetical protein